MTRGEGKRRVEAMVRKGTIQRGLQFLALDAVLAGTDPVRACAPPVAASAPVATAEQAFDAYIAASFPQTARGRRVTAAQPPQNASVEVSDACRATVAPGIGF